MFIGSFSHIPVRSALPFAGLILSALLLLCPPICAEQQRGPVTSFEIHAAPGSRILSSVPEAETGASVNFTAPGFRDLRNLKPSSAADEKGKISITLSRTPLFLVETNSNAPAEETAQTGSAPDSPFGFHPARTSGMGQADLQSPPTAESGESKDPLSLKRLLEEPFAAALDLGVGWHRDAMYAHWFLVQPDQRHIDEGVYQWEDLDRRIAQVPQNMEILGNIGLVRRLRPAVRASAAGPGRAVTWALNTSERAYTDYVKQLVERYDGDGTDDMPGLKRPILVWQFENEPDLNGALSDWKGYAHLQAITFDAVKEACPRARVMMGGLGGNAANFDAFFLPALRKLKGKGLDIFAFHFYGDGRLEWREMKNQYDHIRATLNSLGFEKTEIWITELGSYSGQPGDEEPRLRPGDPDPQIFPLIPLSFQSEATQAMDLVKKNLFALSLGIKKVFWAWGIMEGFKHDDGYFDHTGLIYDGEFDNDPPAGTRKLAYFSYRRMTSLFSAAKWDQCRSLEMGPSIQAFRVPVTNGSITVMWYDPPFSAAELLGPDTLSRVRMKLKAIRTDNPGQGLRVLHDLIHLTLSHTGPQGVESWAPRADVLEIERSLRAGNEQRASSLLDTLVKGARRYFEMACEVE